MTFKTGKSGNPAGRPKGSGDRYKLFQEHVEPHALALMEKAVTMALEGDKAMLNLLLDRLLPAKPKDEPITINLASKSPIKQSETVMKALSEGTISPSGANTLMHTIEIECKIYEADKLQQDVASLMEVAFPS